MRAFLPIPSPPSLLCFVQFSDLCLFVLFTVIVRVSPLTFLYTIYIVKKHFKKCEGTAPPMTNTGRNRQGNTRTNINKHMNKQTGNERVKQRTDTGEISWDLMTKSQAKKHN